MNNIKKIKELVKSNLERIEGLPEDEKQSEAAKYFLALGALSSIDDMVRDMGNDVLVEEAKKSLLVSKVIMAIANYKNLGLELGFVTKEENKKD